MAKPALPKGTRDFSPAELARRNYIFEVLKDAFHRFAFQPIETPVMELLSTLTGKYGEEGDQLLFKILRNGDFLKEAQDREDWRKMAFQICEKGLRYDLTVPFARYVAMRQHELHFPFKRYQIQPVWRGDRPQRGRYQEFYQCDADVIGSESLLYEAELLRLYDQVFHRLGLGVILRLNHRLLLEGLAHYAKVPERFIEMTVVIDKLDKIGWEGVKAELVQRGFETAAVEKIAYALTRPTLAEYQALLAVVPIAQSGAAALQTVLAYLEHTPLSNRLEIDFTLARGLSYYTGCIFEVVLDPQVAGQKDIKMGSLGGGGRYDNLTAAFGVNGLSGVGISFGAERIYDVLLELDRFPQGLQAQLQVLFIAFDEAAHRFAFACLDQVRQAGIVADLYPEPTKLKKQMKYANDRECSFVVLIGETELQSQLLTLKNMGSGEQLSLPLAGVIAHLQAIAKP